MWYVLFLFLASIYNSGVIIDDWTLVKEKEYMKVYTRHAGGEGLKDVKIEGKVKASLAAVIAAIEDVNAHTEWVYKLSVSERLDPSEDGAFSYRVRVNMPFPLRDREATLEMNRQQDPGSDQVVILTRGINGTQAQFDNTVVVTDYQSSYVLTQTDNDWVNLTYILSADPGGKLPDWAINLACVTGPMKTMENLFALLGTGRYGDSVIRP